MKIIAIIATGLTISACTGEPTITASKAVKSQAALPALRGGKPSHGFQDLSLRIKAVSISLAKAKEISATTKSKWTGLGLTNPKDPIEEIVNQSIQKLDHQATVLAARSTEMSQIEQKFIVTDQTGQSELQGARELREQLNRQIDEISASRSDASSSEGEQNRRAEIIKNEIATKVQQATQLKDKLGHQTSKIKAPVRDLDAFATNYGVELDFDPTKTRIDYAKNDYLLKVLQDLDDQVNKIGTETITLDIDISAFDQLAIDMQSLSSESNSIAFQIQQVQAILRVRSDGAKVSNSTSVESLDKLKRLQVGLRLTIDDFKKNVNLFSVLLNSIKFGDRIALSTEVSRLKGASSILYSLAKQEDDSSLKEKFLSIEKIISESVIALDGVAKELDERVASANTVLSEQTRLLDDQDAIEARQRQILVQFDTMIDEQAAKLASYNDVVTRIGDLLTTLQNIAANYDATVAEVINLKTDFSLFQQEFTQAMHKARSLIQKGKLNVASANVTRGWKNPYNRFDSNFDGHINAMDALVIINALNSEVYPTALPANQRPPDAPFVDVNGDGYINAMDPLQVINWLNNQSKN